MNRMNFADDDAKFSVNEEKWRSKKKKKYYFRKVIISLQQGGGDQGTT
jgi:CYTH domain-containing protein